MALTLKELASSSALAIMNAGAAGGTMVRASSGAAPRRTSSEADDSTTMWLAFLLMRVPCIFLPSHHTQTNLHH